MKYLIYFLAIASILVSCGEQAKEKTATAEELIADIKEMDDSLKVLFDKAMETPNFNINPEVYLEAIERNKTLYQSFPKDEFAEKALNKIAALYFQLNMEQEASKWRDTILSKYPNAKNKAILMELQMSYYGNDDSYNKEQIEYFANELLKLGDLPQEKVEEIKFRLMHSDKSFMELIEYQIQNEE